MNHQQYTQRGSEDTMAAATATYHSQPMASGNTAMGMNQNIGGHPNMFGGDSTFYRLDQATFDSQNPPPIDPNQTPLLNNGENDFLQHFFDDPNQLNPFDFTARSDEKAASNGNSLYSADVYDHRTGTINPSATVAQSGQPLHKTHVNTDQPAFSGGRADLLSADDYRAAQTIGTLKASPSTGEYASTPTQNAFAGSWGNFMMPAEQPTLGLDMGFAGAFGQNNYMQGANQARTSFNLSQQQHGGQASNVQQQHFYAQPQPVPPSQPPSQNQGADSASQHIRQQQQPATPYQPNRSSTSALPHTHSRPNLVQWGSDPHFGPGSGFVAPPAQHQASKEGNLLNIYGAEQAAINGQVLKSGRKPTGRGNSITSPMGPNNGATWAAVAMNAPSSSHVRDDGPRKRRKSQADREEQHEWAPAQSKQTQRIKLEDDDDEEATEAPKATAKRRKSAPNRQSVASNSPEPDDDDDEGEDAAFRKKRGSKKARETLSEAQKRDNHIKSEKKRREIITTGYSDLNGLVPCLVAGKSGLSRSECLQEVASYLRSLVDGTKNVMSNLGISAAEWEIYRNSAEGQQAIGNITP